MKRIIYQQIYQILLPLSNRFNSRLLIKLKIFFGASLIILTGSCSKDNDGTEIMCYDPAPPRDSLEIQSTHPSSEEVLSILEMTEG